MNRVARSALFACVLGIGVPVATAGQPVAVATGPEPTLAGIEGTVTSESTGEPLDGIEVEVQMGDYDDPETFVVETDSAGHYELTDLPVMTSVRVAFTDPAEEYGNWWASADLFPGEIEIIDVELSSAEVGWISGVVTDADGNPVADACIERVGGEDGSWCMARTDENGAYTTDKLTPGWIPLVPRVRLPLEFTIAEATVVAGGETIVDFVGSATDAAEIHITASDTGLPVEACVEMIDVAWACTDYEVGDGVAYLVGEVRGQEVDVSSWGYSNATATIPPGTGAVVVEVELEPLPGITGQVTDTSGNPADTCVGVYLAASYSPSVSPYRDACTDDEGNYRVSELPPGSYLVRFADPYSSNDGVFVPSFYSDASTPGDAEVVVVSDTVVAGVDGELGRYGTVSGVVRDAATLTPLGGARIQVAGHGWTASATDGTFTVPVPPSSVTLSAQRAGYLAGTAGPFTVDVGEELTGIDVLLNQGGRIVGTVTDPNGPAEYVSVFASSGSTGSSAQTNAAGHYTIRGLADGAYTVQFSSSSHRTQYFDGAPTAGAATPVTIADAATVAGIDATLAALPRLTGTVTAADTGDPIRGVSVEVQTTSGNYVAGLWVSGSAFDIVVPPGGPYVIRATPSDSSVHGYVGEYYDDAQTAATATTFTVAENDVVDDIDFRLDQGARISGTVTDADGAVADAYVYVYGGIYAATAFTDENGDYEVRGIASGSYVMSFSASGYVSEMFDNVRVYDEATQLTLTAPEVLTGIDAELEKAAILRGAIVDASTGGPLPSNSYARVVVLTPEGESASSGSSFNGGQYAVEAPGGSSYVLRAEAEGYEPTYYPSVASLDEATRVEPDVGETIDGLDIALVPSPKITGVVTDASTGQPIYATVTIYDAEYGWTYRSVTSSAVDGSYSVAAESGRGYKVRVEAPGYVPQYYDGVGSLGQARVLTPELGADVEGIDVALRKLVTVSGTVVADDTGDAITGITVGAYRADNLSNAVNSATTNASGHYQFTLPAGSYVLGFSDSQGRHLTEYWSDQDSAYTAAIVTIDETSVVADASLARGGRISGTVVDADGVPQSTWGYITQIDGSASHSFYTSNGTYTSPALPAGEYLLYVYDFVPGTGNTLYYDGVRDQFDATPVAVVVGETTSGIDFVVGQPDDPEDPDRTATISGTVTAADTGLPLSGACVSAYGGGDSRSICTDAQGSYEFDIVPGELWIYVYSAPGFYVETDSEPVTTVDGESTVVDFELELGGSVVLSVVDEQTGTVGLQSCASLIPVGASSWNGRCGTGTYQLRKVPPGQYQLSVDNAGRYVPEYFDDVYTADEATLITIEAGVATPISVALALGGSAGGSVTNAVTGTPVSGASVTVDGDGRLLASTSTGSSGAYVVTGVLPGTWPVTVSAPGYVPVTLDAQAFIAGGAITGLDVALQPVTADVEATIRDLSTGQPVAGACTYLYDSYDGAYLGLAYCSEADGIVRFIDLEAGEYYLATVAEGYPTNWAAVVAVEGESVSIDILLSAEGAIAATVVDGASGEPVEGACTYLYRGYDADPLGLAYCAGADGVVRFAELEIGDYYLATVAPGYAVSWELVTAEAGVEVTPTIALSATGASLATVSGTISSPAGPVAGVCALLYEGEDYTGSYGCSDETGAYVLQADGLGEEREFTVRAFDPEARYAAGTPVVVTVGDGGSTVGDLSVSPVASVAGRVTDAAGGYGIDGACVYLYTSAGDPAGHATCTRPDGYWVLSGVADGEYKVGIADWSGAHSTWWSGGAADLGSATTVSVLAGQVTTVNAAMQSPPLLRLTVVDGSGSPIEGACVYLYATDGVTPAGYGSCTNANGVVEIAPVAGSYRIAVADPAGRFLTTWYGGTNGSTAADVSIESFVNLGSVAVQGFGDLSGTVTDDGGAPVAGVVVYLNNAEDGSYSGRYGVTDASGGYVIDGLPEGYYTAGFYPEGMASPTTIWYSGASDEASATWIWVPGGGVASGIDAVVPSVPPTTDVPMVMAMALDDATTTVPEDPAPTTAPVTTEAVESTTTTETATTTTTTIEVAVATTTSEVSSSAPPPSEASSVPPSSDPAPTITEPLAED